MEFKDTLLMPVTDFEMRANLNQKEPAIQEKWESKKIYHKALQKNKSNEPYVFLDGPPYANGSIHIGHALNKVLKDINVRYRTLNNMYTPFVLGWDTHGLPIESAIEKSGVKRKEKTVNEFRNICKEYALDQIKNQKEQFKRLGLFTDYSETYFTLQKEYEIEQVKCFFSMLKRGLVFRDLKPVYWSWSSESALAEAEIEYQEKNSPSIYVTFDINHNDILPTGTKAIIWTTTPWTLPANRAISVNPTFDYVVIETNKGLFLILDNLREKLISKLNFEEVKIIKKLKGKELENLTYTHFFNNEKYKLILGEHVSDIDGTGLVHTAPGHGQDDYIVGKKYNLEVVSVVNAQGIMEKAGEFDGLFLDKASQSIIEKLESLGNLLFKEIITHQYPHDWRTKKPIIFRATQQWFITIKNIKNNIIKDLDGIVSYPDWGKSRMQNMIANRGDWCISRQRIWGVPIPIIYDANHEPIVKDDVIQHQINMFIKHGVEAWDKLPIKDLLPDNFNQNIDGYTKEKDIMDVWFDSGTAFNTLLRNFDTTVADVYIEGNDQFRGWFNSSLIISSAVHNKSPYKKLVTHGFVLDEKGHKMSKSKGNVIDPLKVINQYGADVLRLWVSSVDYQEDVRISDNLLKQVAESYRKIRNTIRFMLGNLNNYHHKTIQLNEVDQYMIHLTNELIYEVKNSYENYKYEKVYQLINNFVINDLSAFYLDIAKDVVYVQRENDPRRQQILFVFYHITNTLITLLAPIIPHTCEEAYSFFNKLNKNESVMLEEIKLLDVSVNINVNEWNKIWKLKTDIYQEIEKARQDKIIGKSLEAKIVLKLKNDFKFFETIYLKEILMVSKLEINNEISNNLVEKESCYVQVTKHPGKSCERCWKYFEQDEMFDGKICISCHNAIK
ncbi:hypothetical protein ASO20_02455 [Mycoplasma sp. (ex Biomphalaria glabrata)]|uniref:isoleucine--tRNA ligase n=1 Tax=Mycoplasma sp. (ex Biomphalaria glabrata) TaxID=1749074 RepID=UPI00073A7DAC|nr:isoleucine--tRNA ligase [Mycoplasma sp. (ex Biomphalaria glabrata)]ALV23496.1 hypothetical protein ASO20_02455 [Mycoplasma sp. (ex Biomphalaria glabrata)]